MTEQPEPYGISQAEIDAMALRALESLALRMAGEPAMMAALLQSYARHEGIFGDEGLTLRLGINATQLRHLRLCRRPQGDSPLFGEQVRQVAEHVGMDPLTLANLVRHEEALEAMQEVGGVKIHLQQAAAEAPLHRAAPRMMAARDRIDSEHATVRESGTHYQQGDRPELGASTSANQPAEEADAAAKPGAPAENPPAVPPDSPPDLPPGPDAGASAA